MLIRHSLPLPNHKSVNAGFATVAKPRPHIQYLVDEILRVCKDPQSTHFYYLVAKHFADDLIFQWLSEIRHDPTITNRGAVFITKLKAWQNKHGLPPLTTHD